VSWQRFKQETCREVLTSSVTTLRYMEGAEVNLHSFYTSQWTAFLPLSTVLEAGKKPALDWNQILTI
jgi:hypothetical protein